jgi:hypothetical protein
MRATLGVGGDNDGRGAARLWTTGQAAEVELPPDELEVPDEPEPEPELDGLEGVEEVLEEVLEGSLFVSALLPAGSVADERESVR